MQPQEPVLLTSWKEVAAYLGKGVRTVQRWEARLGMPVRRPDNSKSGIIHVSREELDRWLESRWSPRNNGDRTQAAPANVVRIDLAAARELRQKHHQLVSDLHRSLVKFKTTYEQLCNQFVQVNSRETRAAAAPESQRRSA